MTLNHVHVGVRDLALATEWFERVWRETPQFQAPTRAGYVFGAFMLILDAGDSDSRATLGFASEDCDGDFQALLTRGAVSIDPPSNKPWGARTGYIRGPGELTIEIEGPTT